MRTKVINCGKYECMHNNNGICTSNTIAIDKDGKCILMCKEKPKTESVYSSTYKCEELK